MQVRGGRQVRQQVEGWLEVGGHSVVAVMKVDWRPIRLEQQQQALAGAAVVALAETGVANERAEERGELVVGGAHLVSVNLTKKKSRATTI